MTELKILNAWAANDEEQRSAALAFWRRLEVLPDGIGPEKRLDQLVTTAWIGDRIVGLSTAYTGKDPVYHRPMAYYRYLVDPEFRRQNISREITFQTVEVIEAWARENPERGLIGVTGVWEGRAEFYGKPRSPIWDYGAQLIPPRATEPFVLTSFTEDGLDVWTRFLAISGSEVQI